jgi:hypothetical protein
MPECREGWNDFDEHVRYLAFQMSEVFPEDDPLSEWLITLALAMNDLALVHVRLDEDQEEPDRAFYWNRLAVSHFTEAALFLRDTADVPEVRAFVELLGDEARTKYDKCSPSFTNTAANCSARATGPRSTIPRSGRPAHRPTSPVG